MPARNEAMRGKVLHARFEGPGVLFYASDNDDAEPTRGSAHILMTDNRDQTEQLFNALSKGGTVTTPLDVQPWGDYFGKLTDRFGVQWMLNCRATDPPVAEDRRQLLTESYSRRVAPNASSPFGIYRRLSRSSGCFWR